MSLQNVDQYQEAILRSQSGDVFDIDSTRWIARASDIDFRILSYAVGPVLDLGCGPGRHVEAIAEQGIIVMGVDLSTHAVAAARTRRIAVLERSVFDQVPKTGEWATVLLLDGNIGIGGDPVRLLTRTKSLLNASGRVLIDVIVRTQRPKTELVRIELDGTAGPWFEWANVDADWLQTVADEAGFEVTDQWQHENRVFAVLESSS